MEALLSVFRHWRQRDDLSDEDLVALARKRDDGAVRALIKRHNRRLFRMVRALVRDDNEAEDIVQETYVRAFTGLDRFRGDAAFSTWLTRIALNEAYGRLRRKRPVVDIAAIDNADPADGGQVIMFPLSPVQPGPEAEAAREQVRHILEHAIDHLPEPFRMVFLLREIEGLDTEAAGELLSIKPGTVKTRLFRARRLMRAELEKALSPDFAEIFPFGGHRCARMADRVVERLQAERR
jgi:RNA polymerase sigma-70 factor (ECF subfamily)